jgi:hypothetical protein
MNTPQSQERPPPYTQRQTTNQETASFPTPPVARPTTTPPTKLPLRSILKRSQTSIPNHANTKKSVHFMPFTASPPLAAPGTYKYAGAPRSPKQRHPARSHPCLTSTTQKRADKAMTAVQGPSPTSSRSMKSAPNTSNRVHQPPTGHVSRPPTPPPAAFFRETNKNPASAQRQPATHRPAVKPRNTTLRQQAPALQPVVIPRPHKPTTAPIITHPGSYDSGSENSNTDVRLAIGMAVKKPKPKQKESKVEAKVQAMMVDAETKRSLRALARDFDRKNAWRRGVGV